MKDFQKIRSISGICIGIEGAFGATIFAILLPAMEVQLPDPALPSNALSFINRNGILFYLFVALSTIFVLGLIIFTYGVYDRLKKISPVFAQLGWLACLFGFTLYLAESSIFLFAIPALAYLHTTEHGVDISAAYFSTFFTAISLVTFGSILLGFGIVILNLIAIRQNVFRKGVSYIGFAFGLSLAFIRPLTTIVPDTLAILPFVLILEAVWPFWGGVEELLRNRN